MPETPESEPLTSKVCEGCASFKVFGRGCWFFWEAKKECSQFRSGDTSNPEFKSVKENFELF